MKRRYSRGALEVSLWTLFWRLSDWNTIFEIDKRCSLFWFQAPDCRIICMSRCILIVKQSSIHPFSVHHHLYDQYLLSPKSALMVKTKLVSYCPKQCTLSGGVDQQDESPKRKITIHAQLPAGSSVRNFERAKTSSCLFLRSLHGRQSQHWKQFQNFFLFYLFFYSRAEKSA